MSQSHLFPGNPWWLCTLYVSFHSELIILFIYDDGNDEDDKDDHLDDDDDDDDDEDDDCDHDHDDDVQF